MGGGICSEECFLFEGIIVANLADDKLLLFYTIFFFVLEKRAFVTFHANCFMKRRFV